MATAKPTPGAPKDAAAAAAKAQPKILRIGVIQAGKIVEERLVRRRENVTIGASPRNTIVVPASTLPRSFTLFEIQGGIYNMVFNDTMDGRVSVKDQVLSLDQVRQGNFAKPGKGNLLRLQLTDASRGKVLLGEVTLLFQFVAPPPIQSRPQLPPSVRGGFVTNMDWTLASSFVATGVLCFGFLLFLRTVDIPKRLAVDVVPDDFAEYVPTVEKPKMIDPSTLTKKVGEEKKEKVARKGDGAKRRGPKRKAKPCDKACQETRAAARRARLAKAVSSLGALKLLGTKGKGSGMASDLMKGGDPGRKLDGAFKGVNGLRRGGGSGGLRAKGGGGSGSAADIGALGGRVGGPGAVGTGGMVAEKVPRAVVKRAPPKIDGELAANDVSRTIRRGMGAVKMCYQRALKRNPSLSGKVSIVIEINAMGKVNDVSIDADSIGDPSVSACIKNVARRWRFPPPKGGPAEVIVPFVFQAAR